MNQDEINLDSINYRGIIRDLLKNWWIIVLIVISLYLAATGIGKLVYIPEYTVSTTLVVSAKGTSDTYTSLAMANEMADIIKEVFQSDVLLELVENEIGKTNQGTITCNQIQETNLLVLNVTSKDPQNAYQFMNSALKHYDEVSDYVFTNATLQVLQEPSIPITPSNSSKLINYRNYIALLGGVAVTGIIICLYLFRHTLKSSKNATKLLDGRVVGVIPYEKKKRDKHLKKLKQSLLISSPIASMNFVEANGRMSSRIEYHLNRYNYQVLLVTGISENEVKSTVAANICLSFVEKNKKVLLIDGDFRKPAQYKIFDKEVLDTNPLQDVITGKTTLKESIYFNKKSNIYELFLYHAIDDPSKLMNAVTLKKIMEQLKEHFDYIVIDCSPVAVSVDAEVWMEVVDSTILVIRQDWTDIRVVNDTVDLIWQSNCNFTGFALNMFIDNDSHHNDYGYSYYDYKTHRHESR
ncbi:MAG: polysaccharide biosynthesis tyrosine autokinase [Thomasclavelia spiroformis]